MPNKDLLQQETSNPKIPETTLSPKDKISNLLQLVPDYSFPQDSFKGAENNGKKYGEEHNAIL